jgi:outer membrane protein, heavy metal efflux system
MQCRIQHPRCCIAGKYFLSMRRYISLIAALALYWPLHAQQDTLRVSLEQAEEIFLKKNLLLLSERYQVDAVKANEIQQKLYDNPTISAELATYGSNKKWFDIGGNGQKVFGIEQVITLAGKRNKRVQLAKEQSVQADKQFYDLMRTLKYELRQSFYTVAYADELVTQYEEQMKQLQQIINAYEVQAAKRNVPLKDAVRLKAEYIQLSADRSSIVMESIAARQTLQLLMDTTAFIFPGRIKLDVQTLPDLSTLISLARQNRSDLQSQESQVKQEQLNYNYQRALATPDLTLGAGYDQNGSYVSHFYSLRAAIDIPLFNRNQGNIKAAKSMIRSAELALSYKQSEVDKEVASSLYRLNEAEKEYNISAQSFNKDFPEVNRAVIENFNKGNISLLEFVDFFENYNIAIRQLNQLHKQRRLAWEELEYTLGVRL